MFSLSSLTLQHHSSPSLNQATQLVSTFLPVFFSSHFTLLLSPQTEDGHLTSLSHLGYHTRWRSLKVTVMAMVELEGNGGNDKS